MSEQKWVRSSLRELSRRMKELGYCICHVTVARLLSALGYSLRVNSKRIEGKPHPDRELQFQYITSQREAYQAAGLPTVSVDTKKKELIGNFRNQGRAWSKEAEAVNVHDFGRDSQGRAVPYGIYDTGSNTGFVSVGHSCDTSEFAVDALCCWWEQEGQVRYPGKRQLLILADAGGSNNCRTRLWKQQLQEKLCDRYELEVTVCHYPTGCSKWNPVEHRLFGPISLNWAGKPLRSWELLLGYIRGTTTQTGLSVTAMFNDQEYQNGRGVSKAEMASLNLTPHALCPVWNYTLRPRRGITPEPLVEAA